MEQGPHMTEQAEQTMIEKLAQRGITRRKLVKAAGLTAAGLAFTAPLMTTIKPGPAFAHSGSTGGRVKDFEFYLDGTQEVPPNASPASGHAQVWLHLDTHTLEWDIKFKDLVVPATAAHFHGPAVPGVAAGVKVPTTGFAGLTSGHITGSVVLVDDVTHTVAQKEQQICDGLWYHNIHSSTYPGGEIRGQVVP